MNRPKHVAAAESRDLEAELAQLAYNIFNFGMSAKQPFTFVVSAGGAVFCRD